LTLLIEVSADIISQTGVTLGADHDNAFRTSPFERPSEFLLDCSAGLDTLNVSDDRNDIRILE
jgi:hypothetical protein